MGPQGYRDRPQTSCGGGWEFLHIAIDDHSRISTAVILPDQSHYLAVPYTVLFLVLDKSP